MHARTHAAVSYVGDTTMLHVGHTGHFQVPWATRLFCLRACQHMSGSGTWKHQPCWLGQNHNKREKGEVEKREEEKEAERER